MKNLRKHIASSRGKFISSMLLMGIMLNNILIPEMERFHPNVEIENNAAGLIEFLVESAVDSDLFETDEHDDSSDNLVDSIQKFLNNTLDIKLIHFRNTQSQNQSIYPNLVLAKGFQMIDTPPPQFL